MQNLLMSTISCSNSKGGPFLHLVWCNTRLRCLANVYYDFTDNISFLSGYALDPSVDTNQVSATSYIGAVEEAEKSKGKYNFHLWFCV